MPAITEVLIGSGGMVAVERSDGTTFTFNLAEVVSVERDINGDILQLVVGEEIVSLGGGGGLTTPQLNALNALIAGTASAVDNTARTAADAAQSTANGKQDQLVSATNIKTVNGESLLGSGNIAIAGGGGGSSETGQSLTGSTTLNWPGLSGQYYIVNSASAATLTLPNDAGIPLGTPVRGLSIGAGLISFVSAGAINANAILPTTVDQWSPFELRRVAGGWVRIA